MNRLLCVQVWCSLSVAAHTPRRGTFNPALEKTQQSSVGIVTAQPREGQKLIDLFAHVPCVVREGGTWKMRWTMIMMTMHKQLYITSRAASWDVDEEGQPY
jgi:hypothetical protein